MSASHSTLAQFFGGPSEDRSSDRGKNHWTFEDDQVVKSLVSRLGTKSWSEIARHVPGRTGKQIRDRWNHQLDPAVSKDGWTQEEDEIIISAHSQLKNRWTAIAKLLPGRTGNSVKNHWYSTLRRTQERVSPDIMYPQAKGDRVDECGFSEASQHNCHRLNLGDIVLECGTTLCNAWIGYATWGRLNDEGTNCVLFPTSFKDTHLSNASMIGTQRALDPERWFIVVPNMLGNGQSISPSNARLPRLGTFPAVTMHDNIVCQKLLLDHLHVRAIKLVIGWSVGATQAWYWAVFYPNMVQNLLSICGGSKCWPYNRTILKAACGALEAAADASLQQESSHRTQPKAAQRSFARAFIAWAYSAPFFRSERYKEIGFEGEDQLVAEWERDCERLDANDLLTTLRTWQTADVSAHPTFGGNLASALGGVKARCIVMPCDRDMVVSQEEIGIEVSLTPRAELRPILSSAGHCAGQPGRFKPETSDIEAAIIELLGEANRRGANGTAPRRAAAMQPGWPSGPAEQGRDGRGPQGVSGGAASDFVRNTAWPGRPADHSAPAPAWGRRDAPVPHFSGADGFDAARLDAAAPHRDSGLRFLPFFAQQANEPWEPPDEPWEPPG